jgi:2-phospho-L-lactate guanylyltransferase
MTTANPDIWAVIPVKETLAAKQRLSAVVPQELRAGLVLAMFEDVLEAVSRAEGLAGIAVVTLDAKVVRLAQAYGARILTGGARAGHTGACCNCLQTSP